MQCFSDLRELGFLAHKAAEPQQAAPNRPHPVRPVGGHPLGPPRPLGRPRKAWEAPGWAGQNGHFTAFWAFSAASGCQLRRTPLGAALG